jgi:two-component system sensor histidine kinase/response regulator
MATSPGKHDSSETSKGTILVIDDQKANLDLMVSLLTANGYKVRPAISGGLAIASAKADHPDLILLDIRMPGMDGYEVCRQLKLDEGTLHVPVIFLSAANEISDKINGFKAGGVDYITKPFQAEEVLVRIETHLSIRKMQKMIEEKNRELQQAANFRDEVEQITRHDLKGPLTPIISYPEIICKNNHLTEKELKYLKTIKRAGERILSLVTRSLDLYKMETGKYVFYPVSVDIVQLVKDIVSEIQGLISKKNLSINVYINEQPVDVDSTFNVKGDDLLCYTMLYNPILNAVEASSTGEAITIHLDPGEMSVIRIRNKAVVPESISQNFFEKYVTKGKKSGFGLGTYSAKLSAEVQGGNIEMKSSLEEGTTITIRMPKIN